MSEGKARGEEGEKSATPKPLKLKKEAKAEPESPIAKKKHSLTPESLKSPQSGEAAVKVKKEAKPDPESPLVAKKKNSETPAKAVKKETDVTIKSSKKKESSKSQKVGSAGKVKAVKKEEVVTSSVSTIKKKKASKHDPDKKERKVYSLPGQKHDPPDERDSLRIFYETLYEQNPNSEMAEVWMMEHGLLEADVAKKAFERKKKSLVSQKLGSPVKQSTVVKVKKKSSTVVSIKSKKKSPGEKSAKKKSSTGDSGSKPSKVKSSTSDSGSKPSKVKSSTGDSGSKPSKIKRIRDSGSEEEDDNDFIVKPRKKVKASD